MVFFTCNSCGQSVKKANVEKHYLTECRNCEVLSCMDCGKDFVGDDYKHHTKCVSENEKYGGKDYRATTKPNKGEVKQSQWIECVQAASSAQSVDPRVRGLLNRLADYTNIPRKKAKFEKFIQNSLKVWDPSLIEQTWAVFSKASDKQKTQTEMSTDEAGTCPEKDSAVGPSKKKGDETGAVLDGLLHGKHETKHETEHHNEHHTDGLLSVSKKKKKKVKKHEEEPDKLMTKNGRDGAVHISKKSKHTDGSTNDSEAHEKLDKKTKHKLKDVHLEESDPAQPAKKKKKVKKHEDEPDKLMTKSTARNGKDGAVYISKKKNSKHTDGSTNDSEAYEKLDKKTKHKHKDVQLEESDPAQPAKKKKKVKKHEEEPDKLMTKSTVKYEKKIKSKHTNGSTNASEAHEKIDKKTKHKLKDVHLEESDPAEPAKKKKKKAKVGQ